MRATCNWNNNNKERRRYVYSSYFVVTKLTVVTPCLLRRKPMSQRDFLASLTMDQDFREKYRIADAFCCFDRSVMRWGGRQNNGQSFQKQRKNPRQKGHTLVRYARGGRRRDKTMTAWEIPLFLKWVLIDSIFMILKLRFEAIVNVFVFRLILASIKGKHRF